MVIWGFAFKIEYRFILTLNKKRISFWIREVFLTVRFYEFEFKGQIKPKADWRAVDSPKK